LKSNIALSITGYLRMRGRYNHRRMEFVIHIVARIIVPLFFIGMAGSAVVIVVSFAEDLKELLGDED
jgi:hypothetical protein